MPQTPFKMDVTVEETGMDDVHLVSSIKQRDSLLQHLTSIAQTTPVGESSGPDASHPSPSSPTVFTPVAGWVAKSRLAARWDGFPSNSKVFLNMCAHPAIPTTRRFEDASLSLGPIGRDVDKGR